MQQKTILAAIIVVVFIVCGFAVWKLHTSAPVPVAVATNSGWEVYQDKAKGFSFEYPPTFEATSTNYNGYSVTRIYDPNTNAGYLSIMVVNDPAQPDISEIFTGPYPKELSPTSNSAMTVDEKTLNGMQGVEEYGYIQEGHSYSDVFMYKGNHLWEIYLDPVLEGRITTYPESDTPTPDRDTYEKILASIKIPS